MAESELLCVRVATLLRSKYAIILRVMSQDSTCCQNCQYFYCIDLDICLALATAQKKKKEKKKIYIYRHCSGHNLGKDKLKS